VSTIPSSRPRVAVVHLVRAANGMGPLLTFLEAYRRNPPATGHELVLALKGFSDADLELHRAAWSAVPARELRVPDEGYDLGTYRVAARTLDHDVVCFVNSFSRPLHPHWLDNLVAAVEAGAGLVGATGSWESHATNATAEPFPLRLWRGLHRQQTPLEMMDFPRFPNPHIRTNAFAIRRALFLSLEHRDIISKADAYQLESGYRSITRQVHDLGLPVLVAAADGRTYGPDQWPSSGTFRSRDQENLLVADNATDGYARAGRLRRRRRRSQAWGAPTSG
jgi:hypothetical protein